MTDLSPGQEVTVSGMHGGAAEVVYVRGGNVRVRMLSTHCPRTVPLSRVTPKRESKALVVGPGPLNSIGDMLAPIQRGYHSGLRHMHAGLRLV